LMCSQLSPWSIKYFVMRILTFWVLRLTMRWPSIRVLFLGMFYFLRWNKVKALALSFQIIDAFADSVLEPGWSRFFKKSKQDLNNLSCALSLWTSKMKGYWS
jgi:hypothetical protein